ncbi:MAG TPA: RNA ligase family protein, partial [Candidatus Hodarchaeales archaeon]|nr:RNA ligase family protein [Candidatus Hodarchaeales archaeon]
SGRIETKESRVIHSYPQVYQIGHKAIKNIFDGPVLVQEKIDGSSFSFGFIDGELQCRSKGKQLILDAPEKMFTRAIETAKELARHLHPNWVYRAEYLEKPKHNTIAYSRIPNKHLILYDINTGTEEYLYPNLLSVEGEGLGLEVVPKFFEGVISDFTQFKELLERESVLGGSKIEGFVVKNYSLFTQEKKVAMGKYVREDFKEENAKDFRARNPTGKDITQILIMKYKTEARWRKAIQHLREQGLLEDSPKDIGLLVREVPSDILKECETEIKDALFEHFWKNISRGVTAGLPEFYKEELAKSAFAVK